jgi:hypothetical protein
VGQFRDARAIVFDVRGNGGGTTPERLLRAVMDRPYRDWSQANAASVGLFRAYAKVPELVRPGELPERDAGYYCAFSEFAFPQLVAPGGLIHPEGAPYRGRILVLTDFDCGADIRVIQQMLGHVNLTTTELYTLVSINLVRQVYSATHPAAHLKRPETPATTARDVEAEAELFDALAAESQEESEDEDQ